MEITQEDLDKKIAEAKKTATQETQSAKDTEWQTKVDDHKKESEAKVDKITKESQKKVSEQADELGTLRKYKEEAAPKLTAAETMQATIKEHEEKDKKAADAAKKKEEDTAKDPAEHLRTLKVTDEEAKQIDDTAPDAVKKLFADPKTRDQAFVDSLLALREAKKQAPEADSLTAWLEAQKKGAVNDPVSVREVMKEALKQKDAEQNRLPSSRAARGGRPGTPVKKGEEGKPQRWEGMKHSAYRSKQSE